MPLHTNHRLILPYSTVYAKIRQLYAVLTKYRALYPLTEQRALPTHPGRRAGR